MFTDFKVEKQQIELLALHLLKVLDLKLCVSHYSVNMS